MSANIERLPFPDFLCKTPCTINLEGENIDENGRPTVYRDGISAKCIFSEKAKRIYDKDGKTIILSGRIVVKGDIAPELNTVSGGSIVINGKTMRIYSGCRPRNPDGTVHHTLFEVR